MNIHFEKTPTEFPEIPQPRFEPLEEAPVSTPAIHSSDEDESRLTRTLWIVCEVVSYLIAFFIFCVEVVIYAKIWNYWFDLDQA